MRRKDETSEWQRRIDLLETRMWLRPCSEKSKEYASWITQNALSALVCGSTHWPSPLQVTQEVMSGFLADRLRGVFGACLGVSGN